MPLLAFLLFAKFTGSLLTLIVGITLLVLIRKKTTPTANRPAGFWIRALCLGTDLALIDLFSLSIAYRGSLSAAGYITALITFSYFFFFWLFFSATPAQVLARIKIVSHDNQSLKIWQILARLGMFIFLFIGWITTFFNKDKRALHDLVARTQVVYLPEKIKHSLTLPKFILLGLIVILIISLIVFGRGEKIATYSESDSVKFFDLNKDGINDGLTIDSDADGKVDTIKYDLDNDRVVDFTTLDADGDNVAESIDLNNDGRIDGYDFDNDNELDIKVTSGQLFLWLPKILLALWAAAFIGLLARTIILKKE